MSGHEKLREYAENLYRNGSNRDYVIGRDILDLIDSDVSEEYSEIIGDLKKATGLETVDTWRHIEFINEKMALLAELVDQLDQAGYKNPDPTEALKDLIQDLPEKEYD